MPPVGQFVLTPKGQEKLRAAMQRAAEAAQINLAREMQLLRSEVAARAPSSEEEGRLLSRGVNTNQAGGIGFGLGLIGTPEGGRFIRQGEMISLREAIQTEPIKTVRRIDRMLAGIGDPDFINARTGFYWQTRSRGIQGPTLPFNRAYLQALENGGLVWIVVPRPENRRGRLEPEPGVTARSMVKTLPPQRMYRGTLFARQAEVRQRLGTAIRSAVREVGIG